MQIGSIVKWDTSSNMHKSQNKISKKKPDFLIIVSCVGNHSYKAVPCWKSNPGYTMCIYAKPENLFVDAKKIIIVRRENLHLSEEYCLSNVDDALERIRGKNVEISEKKRLAKIKRKENKIQKLKQQKEAKKRAKDRKERIESTYGVAYEIAVISNDRKAMQKIEKKVGYDPRAKQKGVKSGTKLKNVSNSKPCTGGKVSPK